MLVQWPYLVGYCERGDLHISNILKENAIRPFAVDRKAWLFGDSATGYSLLETAKANDLEPSGLFEQTFLLEISGCSWM